MDPKLLLRLLKDMGEFVKGPSSSIEPPVARKLRARAQEHMEGLPSPAARAGAVPAPPGTRWRVGVTASEPASLDVFAAVQDPPPRTTAPAAAPIRKAEAPPVRKAEAPPVRKTLMQPEPALPPQRVPQRRAPQRGKTPRASRSVAPAAKTVTTPARRVRPAAHPTPVPPQIRQLPEREAELTLEQSRLLVRQGMVTRSNFGWSALGFSVSEQQKWVNAGLRPDQAHVAAMCRAFRGRSLFISPTSLSVRLSTGRTVREEFSVGTNAVEVLSLFARIQGVSLIPEFDRRVMSLVEEPVVAPPNPPRSTPVNTGPRSVPEFADYLNSIAAATAGNRDVQSFNRERYSFIVSGSSAPLLNLYAQAHGVFRDAELLKRLVTNLPARVMNVSNDAPLVELIGDAIPTRKFFHLSAAAASAVTTPHEAATKVPEVGFLPSASGFAVVQPPPHLNATGSEILVWSHSGSILTAATIRLDDLPAGLSGLPEPVSMPVASHLDSVTHRPIHMAVAISTLMRLRDETPSLSGAPILQGPQQQRPTPVPPDRTGKAIADADYVSLVYAPGERRNDELGEHREGRKAENRWMVEGHMRRQYYASTKEHKPIWIAAHESGASDADLLIRDRVRVLR